VFTAIHVTRMGAWTPAMGSNSLADGKELLAFPAIGGDLQTGKGAAAFSAANSPASGGLLRNSCYRSVRVSARLAQCL
jgi:hypothetical protein